MPDIFFTIGGFTMTVLLDDIDLFLMELLDEGDWVEQDVLPDWLDLTDVRFTTKEKGISFGQKGLIKIKHYDKNELIDVALDKRAEINVGSETYVDTDSEQVPAVIT